MSESLDLGNLAADPANTSNNDWLKALIGKPDEAAHLFEDTRETRIDRVFPRISADPKAKAPMLCFVDVVLMVATKSGHYLPLKLNNLTVKILKGKLHVDMPAEKSKTSDDWFDIYFPLSAAFRQVLTTRIASDPRVINCAKQLKALLEAEATRVAAETAIAHAGASSDGLPSGMAPEAEAVGASPFAAGNPFATN